MQHDDMIWHVVSNQFCSFKTHMRRAHSDKTTFCQHPYSVTGLCNRTSCPLANSLYATLREEHGRVYLCMKTVERAHSPKNLWEKILLSRNYSKALAQIDEHLVNNNFSKILIHRNKQRLTKIHQYLIRMRKIELKMRAGTKAKMVRVHRKIDQREERRERKAMVAARLEKNIEQELMERLARGTYGDIYNFPESSYKKALEKSGGEGDKDRAEEEDEEDNEEETEMESEEEEEEDDEVDVVEYVEDLESGDEDEEEDIEDMEYVGDGKWAREQGGDDNDDDDEEESSDDDEDSKDSDDDNDSESSSSDSSPKQKKKKKPKKPPAAAKKPAATIRRGPRIEIEYEEEREDTNQEPAALLADSNATAW